MKKKMKREQINIFLTWGIRISKGIALLGWVVSIPAFVTTLATSSQPVLAVSVLLVGNGVLGVGFVDVEQEAVIAGAADVDRLERAERQ